MFCASKTNKVAGNDGHCSNIEWFHISKSSPCSVFIVGIGQAAGHILHFCALRKPLHIPQTYKYKYMYEINMCFRGKSDFAKIFKKFASLKDRHAIELMNI